MFAENKCILFTLGEILSSSLVLARFCSGLKGRRQGSLFESRWFVVFICLNLKFTISCGLPT